MIIAQITDLHLGFDGRDKPCQNTKRLRAVITGMKELRKQPDILLMTGDLVESGEAWAYKKLRDELEDVPWPYYLGMGNHDNRQTFIDVFPDQKLEDGFLQYTIEDFPIRIIMLDTLETGRHGGGFCEVRKTWLKDRLAEQPDRPTLIALHHPPIDTGIAWMTADVSREWVSNLSDVVSGAGNVVHMISGHIHRPIYAKFAGTSLSVSPAVAPHVKLELDEIDPEYPDDRVLLVENKASFCLHRWNGSELITHSTVAPTGRPIVRYDEKHAFVVKHTLDLDHD